MTPYTVPAHCPTCDAEASTLVYVGEDLYRCSRCAAVADAAEIADLQKRDQARADARRKEPTPACPLPQPTTKRA